MSKILDYIQNDRNECFWLFGCFALCVWMLFGCFPLINIEGDSALYAAGCERMYQIGMSFPPDYIYVWDMQPLIGVVIVLLRYVLPLTCEQIYCLLTVIASYAFLFLVSKFIERLTEVKWYKAFCLLFLLPESYSIAFYPNTAIFAVLAAFGAFYILMDRPFHIGGLLLLGIAPLFRVDVLMIYPIVLFLFWRKYSLKRVVIYSTLCAVVTLAILVFGCWLLGANPMNTFYGMGYVGAENAKTINGVESFVRIHLAFYTVLSMLMIVVGLVTVIKDKDWKSLGLVLFPIVITYFLYFPFRGSATKHLLYMLPSCAVCVVFAFSVIVKWVNRHQIIGIILLLLCALQYVISISIVPTKQPWFGKEYASQFASPVASIYSTNVGGNRVNVGFGVGQVIPTADEMMFATGHVFAPWKWNAEKNNVRQAAEDVHSLLLQFTPEDTVRFMTTQASDWQFAQCLHGLGYCMQEKVPIRKYVHDKLPCIEITYFEIERSVDSFESAYKSMVHPVYFYYNWDWQKYYVNEGLTSAKPIGNQLAIIE